MILRRLLLALMAAATFAAATAVIVVALAFGLYALIEPHWGRAGAAACVALAAAVLMGLVGVSLSLAARLKRLKKPVAPQGGLLERALAFVREKPIVAASAAVGAGLMAARNPKYLGEVFRAFFEGGSRPK